EGPRAGTSTRGGAGAEHLPLPSDLQSPGPLPLDVVALDRALEALDALDARKAQVVELRFFGGLTVEETAQVLEVAPDTVARDWRMARSWLLRELAGGRESRA